MQFWLFNVLNRRDETEARKLIFGCSRGYQVTEVEQALASVHHVHQKTQYELVLVNMLKQI